MSPLTVPFNITLSASTLPSMAPVSLTDKLEPSTGSARVQGNVYYGVIEMTLGAQIMGKLTSVSEKSAVTVPEGAAEST
jgi:hypothetical protein